MPRSNEEIGFTILQQYNKDIGQPNHFTRAPRNRDKKNETRVVTYDSSEGYIAEGGNSFLYLGSMLSKFKVSESQPYDLALTCTIVDRNMELHTVKRKLLLDEQGNITLLEKEVPQPSTALKLLKTTDIQQALLQVKNNHEVGNNNVSLAVNTQGQLCLVMPYMKGWDGVDYLNLCAEALYMNPPQIEPSLLLFLTYQMIEQIQSLHDKGFVHRDIKLENFFIEESGRLHLIDVEDMVKEGVKCTVKGTDGYLHRDLFKNVRSIEKHVYEKINKKNIYNNTSYTRNAFLDQRLFFNADSRREKTTALFKYDWYGLAVCIDAMLGIMKAGYSESKEYKHLKDISIKLHNMPDDKLGCKKIIAGLVKELNDIGFELTPVEALPKSEYKEIARWDKDSLVSPQSIFSHSIKNGDESLQTTLECNKVGINA